MGLCVDMHDMISLPRLCQFPNYALQESVWLDGAENCCKLISTSTHPIPCWQLPAGHACRLTFRAVSVKPVCVQCDSRSASLARIMVVCNSPQLTRMPMIVSRRLPLGLLSIDSCAYSLLPPGFVGSTWSWCALVCVGPLYIKLLGLHTCTDTDDRRSRESVEQHVLLHVARALTKQNVRTRPQGLKEDKKCIGIQVTVFLETHFVASGLTVSESLAASVPDRPDPHLRMDPKNPLLFRLDLACRAFVNRSCTYVLAPCMYRWWMLTCSTVTQP